YAIAFALRVIVETAAALPLAAVDVPRGPLTAIVLAGACAGAVVAVRRLAIRLPRIVLPRPPAPPSRRAVAIACAPVLLIATILAGTLATASPAFRIRALDIGQGDAFLVEAGGKIALIDGGPDPARLLAELGAAL